MKGKVIADEKSSRHYENKTILYWINYWNFDIEDRYIIIDPEPTVMVTQIHTWNYNEINPNLL